MMCRIIYVFVAALAVGSAAAKDSVIHKEACGENKAVATIEALTVEGCGKPPCLLFRGSNAHLNVTFTPKQEISVASARAYGKVGDMYLPYKVPQTNACENSGLTCPLAPGKQVIYNAILPVETWYPMIPLIVKWELLGQDGIVIFCTEIPVKIVKANHKED